MPQYNGFQLYKATNDLLLAIFQFTMKFCKEYKCTVGESLKKENSDSQMKTTKRQQRTKLKNKLFVHNFSFRITFLIGEVSSKEKIIAFVA